MICGSWLKANSPRIKAYNNVENYEYSKTISDDVHMSRPYNNSTLTQKQVIKYGKMTNDASYSGGYIFTSLGKVNGGKEKVFRLVVNPAKKLVVHWGHGF